MNSENLSSSYKVINTVYRKVIIDKLPNNAFAEYYYIFNRVARRTDKNRAIDFCAANNLIRREVMLVLSHLLKG